MSNQNTSIRTLLSPARSGTFFAPFRSRSANPDGFDSKMKIWISAIEEWLVHSKRLKICIDDIYRSFTSESGIKPDRECIRLVFSEMRRRSQLVPIKTLKSSSIWCAPDNNHQNTLLDNYIDPNGWIGWGVKNFIYNPASWAITSITKNTMNTESTQIYSDLTDLSISDQMIFVSSKSLHVMSQNLLLELFRISKAERQICFEWHHLLELMTPIISTTIDATDSKELLEILDMIIEYLAMNKRVAIKLDNETKLVKISNQDESRDDNVIINQKDIAIARLLRAKELLTADMDKYLNQAQTAKDEAVIFFKRNEIAKAKSLLRSHKRLNNCAEQKDCQLRNVEELLDTLENTDSNKMILEAYKEGAEALAKANSNIDTNMTILDDLYDATSYYPSLYEVATETQHELRPEQSEDIQATQLEDHPPLANSPDSKTHEDSPKRRPVLLADC